MFDQIEYSVCTDCLFYIAYSDLPEDKERAQELLDAHISNDIHTTDTDYGYCTSPCETCGTRLHGDRYKAIELRRVTV